MAMQIRLTMTSEQLAAERKRSESRDAMLQREDARAIGATTALKTGGTRKPRTYQKSSPCLVTRADGTQYVIASKSAKQKIARRTFVSNNAPTHRITAADLKPLFAD